MPTYVLLTNLAASGLETLNRSPARVKEVNEEITQLGCKLIAQYALLGPYDFLNIIEAPDNETMAQLSIELGARGTATHLTMPAVSTDALMARFTGGIHLAR
jgi:uncharacterized protein with GYD domain